MMGVSRVAGFAPELSDERQPVDAGHDQILENDGGLDLIGALDGFLGVPAIMEINIGLIGERAADGFAHHQLIIHEQHLLALIPGEGGGPRFPAPFQAGSN